MKTFFRIIDLAFLALLAVLLPPVEAVLFVGWLLFLRQDMKKLRVRAARWKRAAKIISTQRNESEYGEARIANDLVELRLENDRLHARAARWKAAAKIKRSELDATEKLSVQLQALVSPEDLHRAIQAAWQDDSRWMARPAFR